MIKLSNYGVIPHLFSRTEKGHYNEAGYFSADGGIVFPWYDGTVDFKEKSEVGKGSGYNKVPEQNGVRCVYDEWYWGSAQGTKNSFTWGDRELF